MLTGSRLRQAKPVDSRTIGLGVVLLSGVLVIAYGFFQDLSEVMDLGIIITGMSSWTILTLAITRGRSRHQLPRYR